MSERYSEIKQVQLHEIGPGGTLKEHSLFNYMQSIAGSHSRSLGYGSINILKEGLTWVISRYRLQIISLPVLFQNFSISTWRSGESGTFAIREYLITDESGRPMVKGTSSWSLINFIKGEPVKPSERFPGYPICPERAIDDSFSSIPSIESYDYSKEFKVRRFDLDANNHVNNSFYAAWMLETGIDMNEKLKPADISVNFKGEAKYGDIIISQALLDKSEGRTLHRLILKDSGRELTRGITEWR